MPGKRKDIENISQNEDPIINSDTKEAQHRDEGQELEEDLYEHRGKNIINSGYHCDKTSRKPKHLPKNCYGIWHRAF